MKKTNNYRITILTLSILLLSVIATFPIIKAQDYSSHDEWTMGGYDKEYTRFSPSSMPDKPDVLWKNSASMTSRGGVTIFDGKTFVPGSSALIAYDAYTGKLIYERPYPERIRPDGINLTDPTIASWVTKIDDEYMYVYHRYQLDCAKIDTGEWVWSIPMYVAWGAGSGYYWHGDFDPDTKTLYAADMTADGLKLEVIALDLSNPSQEPTAKWRYRCDEGAEIISFGDGTIFLSAFQASIYAIDGETGNLLWRKQTKQTYSYTGTYQDGRLYFGAGGKTLYCLDATNGETIWEFDAPQGFFFDWGGALAYGTLYHHAVYSQMGGGGIFYAIDIDTGLPIWQYFGEVGDYVQPVVADGKVFFNTGSTSTCFDAYTGAELWKIPYAVTNPSIAYGNLYGYSLDGTVWCFGPPKPWSMWRGSTETPGIGQSGPSDINNPKWKFTTGGPVSSSPAVDDGKVYFGSHDHNLYCIDAYDGTLIWNFTLGYKVQSSPAVVNGKVYTGADDGNIYCLNAETGTKIWETYAGGWMPIMFATTWQPRSSPIIVGNKLYVGALDGKVYCLNTGTGSIEWTFQTGNPIGGSPAYKDGVIYIRSTDTYLYALDSSDGDLIWKIEIASPWGYHHDPLRHVATPLIADDVLYIGSGRDMYFGAPETPEKLFAINITDGSKIWGIPLGGINEWVYPASTPAYFNGVIYYPQGNSMSSFNATDGTRIANQWIGHVIYSSPIFADDPRGAKVYVGSSVYSITCLDAKDLTPLSVFTSNGQIESSPALWEGKLYVGSQDWNLYCFEDPTPAPPPSPTIYTEQTAHNEQPTTTAQESEPLENTESTEEDKQAESTEIPTEPQPQQIAETPLISTEIIVIATVAVVSIIGVAAYWFLRRK